MSSDDQQLIRRSERMSSKQAWSDNRTEQQTVIGINRVREESSDRHESSYICVVSLISVRPGSVDKEKFVSVCESLQAGGRSTSGECVVAEEPRTR